jgi:exodeoxyribonuclease X
MTSHYYVVDTETASMKGPIVDFALIEINENLDIVRVYESLVDPLTRIVPAAQAVHGITQAMVADAPTMAELVERDGNPFASDGPITLIGHNIRFDVRMLQQANLLPEKFSQVCTLRTARNMWSDLVEDEENHKLGTLAVMFCLETGPAHRAMGDCVTCLSLLRHMAGAFSSFDDLMLAGTRVLSPDTKMTFGKHRGMKLRDLPSGYIKWVLAQEDMDPDLKAALVAL